MTAVLSIFIFVINISTMYIISAQFFFFFLLHYRFIVVISLNIKFSVSLRFITFPNKRRVRIIRQTAIVYFVTGKRDWTEFLLMFVPLTRSHFADTGNQKGRGIESRKGEHLDFMFTTVREGKPSKISLKLP